MRTFASEIQVMPLGGHAAMPPLGCLWLLGYGVMVTLQILVLSFLVRIRVPQQKGLCRKTQPLFLCLFAAAYVL